MLARIILSLILCALVACGSNTRAPVEDRVPAQLNNEHIVARGDTLYSIAFSYGLDYRKMAVANDIGAPFTIYPGQRIRLEEGELRPEKPAVATAYPAGTAAPATSVTHSKPSRPAPPVIPRDNTAAATVPPVVASTPTPPAPTQAPEKSPEKPQPSVAKPVAFTGGEVSTWRWPTSGAVTRGYSKSVHKGIDIGGKRGDPVVAVAPGSVVYAGTGIVGLGQLLILKHNEIYLSAYGHNDALLVAEGEIVAAGQTIARKGSSATDTVKLHFEIRKEGKPIDPQRVLPRR